MSQLVRFTRQDCRHAAVGVVPAVILISLGHLTIGVAFAIGLLPTSLMGIAPTRRLRVLYGLVSAATSSRSCSPNWPSSPTTDSTNHSARTTRTRHRTNREKEHDMMRRMGRPGLVGTMARTAVIAGTATAVAGGVNNHQRNKQQAAYEQDAAQQAAFDSQQQIAEMQAQMNAMQAQQATAAPPPAPAPIAAAPAAPDLMTELSKLADLKAAGVLTDEEFAAAKAKLLG